MAKKKYFEGYITGKLKNFTYYRSHSMYPFKGGRSPRQVMGGRPVMEYPKMALATSFAQALNPFIKTTYEVTGIGSPFHQLVKDLLLDAIEGDDRSPYIDYSKVKVSRGSLLQPCGAYAQSSGHFVHFIWDKYSGLFNIRRNDRAVLVAYCEPLQQCVYATEGIIRITGKGILDVQRFAGYHVHTWVGLISRHGKKAADSIYTGRV